MGNYNEVFRQELHKLRRQRGISQEELGRSVGVNKSTISKYERGIIVPTLDVAKRIASFFGVTVESLVNPDTSTSDCITLQNAKDIIGMPKNYIKALKIAEANGITAEQLINLINFSINIKEGKE